MKVKYIFMIGVMGLGYPIMLYASDGPSQSSEQMRSPQLKGVLSFLNKRSSSHSSSVTISSDQQSDGKVGSFDSASSMHSASSSSSSLSVASSQSRLARVMARLSKKSTRVSTIPEQDEWVVVEDESKKKSESLEKALMERRRLLDRELDDAQSIVIPGVIKAALNIFQREGYASQAIAGRNNDAVADIQNTLGHLKNVLHNYLEVKEGYERKLEVNFERVGSFCPKGLYMYLGLTVQEGKSASSDDIKKRIDSKKTKNITDNTQWMLRQTEYVFDNSESKKLYDAYLEGQDDLFAQKDKEHYWYLYQIVVVSRAAIESAAYEYNKLLKESQSQHNASPDLADHALSLDLDVKTNVS